MRGGGGHGWRRLAPLLAAAALGWGAALAVAALLAAGLAPISVDQPIYGRELVGWGMRWGAVLAVALASGAMLGPSPPASLRRLLLVVGAAALVLVGLSLLAAALGVLAVRLQLWGQAWELPSRSGQAARLAALMAIELLGLPCATGAGWLLLRQRMGQAKGERHG
ncbi:MAG: hypothetical protein ACK54Z_06800 [Cyanobacteriota bacterium]